MSLVTTEVELVPDNTNGFGYLVIRAPGLDDSRSVTFGTNLPEGTQFEFQNSNNLLDFEISDQGIPFSRSGGAFSGRYWDGVWSTSASYTAQTRLFDIEYRDATTQTSILVTGVSGYEYNLSALDTGKTYEYRVRESDGIIDSVWTDWQQFTTTSTDQALTLPTLQQLTQVELVPVGMLTGPTGVEVEQLSQIEVTPVTSVNVTTSPNLQQITQVQTLSPAAVSTIATVILEQLSQAEVVTLGAEGSTDIITVAVQQLLETQAVSATQAVQSTAITGATLVESQAVNLAADYSLVTVTGQQLTQVEVAELLDGTGLQVVTIEQGTEGSTADVTLVALMNVSTADQSTDGQSAVAAATLVITARDVEQLSEVKIAELVSEAMIVDPRTLRVKRTTIGYTVNLKVNRA